MFLATAAVAGWQGEGANRGEETKKYIYRVAFNDKQGSVGDLTKPHKFLSKKAVERRRRQGLSLDSTDLPVSRLYLRQLSIIDCKVIGTSRWNNTALVRTADSDAVNRIAALHCVKSCMKVWQSPDTVSKPEMRMRIHDAFNSWDSVKTSRYASAEEQITMMNGQMLHAKGFTGKGMTIAVLDGGFQNVDRLMAFANVNIDGTSDFVYPPSTSIFQETEHGTKVLSTMAVNAPNVYVGTAPDASYWLLRCEDQQSEQLVEEDYWTMAAEFADSVGADVINSSVGYTRFDDHSTDHRYYEMDGHSTLISNTASMIARKGMVLVNSAGNTGMGPWKKMTFPADADDILAVGAVEPSMTNAAFSSVGPTSDGRVKPDVMALGSPASVVSARGTIIQSMGTSFAAPIVCGLVACLWQSMPDKTATEIIDMVRRSGNNAAHPDNVYGYGVPDFSKFTEQKY